MLRALRRLQASYLEAAATAVDMQQKTVACSYTKPFLGSQFTRDRAFEIPYDILVVAVRAKKSLLQLLSCRSIMPVGPLEVLKPPFRSFALEASQ